jgi:hypothetical protein
MAFAKDRFGRVGKAVNLAGDSGPFGQWTVSRALTGRRYHVSHGTTGEVRTVGLWQLR